MYRFAVLFCASLAISPAIADSYSDSPSCSKPYKPFEFSDESEYENFLDDVRQYKQCIQDFVDEQNEAIRNHQAAAQEAIDEWDRFVSLELN